MEDKKEKGQHVKLKDDAYKSAGFVWQQTNQVSFVDYVSVNHIALALA